MASISVPTSRTINDPKVNLTVDPIARTVAVEVTEMCPTCSGYGSPCGTCRGDGTLRHPCGVYNDREKTHERVENTLAGLLGVEAAKEVLSTLQSFVTANAG